MKRKAAGPDGWSSDLMLQLPDQAWDQLVSLVQQIEAKGQWPANLHHWKITFIPKTKSSGAVPTEALKVRPVSVGPVLYRCWAKLRFRHIGWQLVQALPSLQAGGLPGLGAETLVCALQNETSPSSHPYAVSLDFSKAFDSCDWQLAVQLLQRARVADVVCSQTDGSQTSKPLGVYKTLGK